jgi:gluconokinase
MSKAIILFGVTGCGKTTIAKLLAEKLGWQFFDADDFHSAANVEKMRNGIPLTDEDRKGWLESLRTKIVESAESNTDITLACSALKVAYRTFLKGENDVKFVFLKADIELVKKRLDNRKNHFMNPKLIDSQFVTLETFGEIDLELDSTFPANTLVDEIVKTFAL